LYDIYDLLSLDRSKKVYLCPLPTHVHHNNTPSFSVRTFKDGVQRFRCFGSCGLGGDVVDLIGYIQIPGYDPKNPEMVRMAAARLQGEKISPPVFEQKKTSLEPGLWRKYTPPSERVIAYGISRGLTLETLQKFKIGEKRGAMAIPVFENAILKAIKFRSTARNPKVRYWSEEGSVVALFNHDAVALSDDPILVVKGEIPAMLLDQLGFKACAPTAGEGRSDMSQWAHLFSFSKKVVVVGDNDPDPKVREKIVAATKIRAEQLHAELRFPAEQWKDIDAWLLAEPAAIQVVRAWLTSDVER